MLEVGPELPHPCEGVADRLGQLGLPRDSWQLRLQPALQIIEDRLRPCLPEPQPFVGWAPAPLFLDGVEPSY